MLPSRFLTCTMLKNFLLRLSHCCSESMFECPKCGSWNELSSKVVLTVMCWTGCMGWRGLTSPRGPTVGPLRQPPLIEMNCWLQAHKRGPRGPWSYSCCTLWPLTSQLQLSAVREECMRAYKHMDTQSEIHELSWVFLFKFLLLF